MILHNLNYEKKILRSFKLSFIYTSVPNRNIRLFKYSFEQFFCRTTLKTTWKTAGDDIIHGIFLATSVRLGNLSVSGLKNSNALMLLYKRLKFEPSTIHFY